MMLKTFLLPIAAALLAGCATTVGLDATESRSGIDGARVVDVAPHATDCDAQPCAAIGAQWSSRAPDLSIVRIAVFDDKLSGVRRAEAHIDGRAVQLRPMPGLSTFSAPYPGVRQSSHDFTVPLDEVRRLAVARKAWVRIYTVDGYFENRVVDGDRDSKAVHALRRFLARVDAQPKS